MNPIPNLEQTQRTGQTTTPLVIDRVGVHGDGVAETPGTPGVPVFVPFALPGETWLPPATGSTRFAQAPQSTPSPDRATPICRHFGMCGGCVAQHMAPNLYSEWKRGIVVEAFRQRGLDADVGPLVAVTAHSRRRAAFTAVRAGSRIHLGYHERASHTVCDVTSCPVLAPAIEAALPSLKVIAGLVLSNGKAEEVRITVTLAKHGLDVAITGAGRKIDARGRIEAIGLAQKAGIQRLIVDGDSVLAGAIPVVTVSGVDVALPDQTFLQAVPQAEDVIAKMVVSGVSGLKSKKPSVVDLFCGLGTFTFALAKSARVFALDGDTAAIAALSVAAKHVQGIKQIEARRRDLFRDPLSERELRDFDAVVLDPPRAGAAAQVATVAKSKVPKIVMVSCNPATLARDVRTLVDGGYHLGPVTPIDQFLWSAHVEAVAVLKR
jgi:23S rRNA (uracil1939-C5)-methyltransferase